jgi:hypothetical protein
MPKPAHSLIEALANVPIGAPYYAQIVKNAPFAAPVPRDLPPPQPDAIMALFETWRRSDIPPLELLLPMAPDDSDLCMVAALIASVPSDLSFHNQHHVREVVCLAMMMTLDKPLEMQRELFVAACIHDFGHDGMSNRRAARHKPMRLERQALDLSYPYLKAAGMTDAMWKRITVMVLATDVSKDDSGATSPAEWMRRAVNKQSSDGCPPELLPLFTDPDLTMQTAILEDADLGTSAALPYEHASRMTALVADETGMLAPTPQTLISFLDHICHGAFLTQEALNIFGDNIMALRARAVDEQADTIYNWS